MNSYLPMFFGEKIKNEKYNFSINIEEKKKKDLLKQIKQHQI